MYDVASSQCFRKIGIGLWPKIEQKVGFNSKFMVVAKSDVPYKSKLKIYDLEAMKNPKSTENDILVRTVTVESELRDCYG